MTITLAAVYAPIGFQGGLTGALFREFAFTLAGRGVHLRRRGAHAVADDVVAAAQRARAPRRWLAAHVDRGFEARASAATRARSPRRCASRPASTRSGSCSRCSIVPMYMFSPEGAGAERGPGRRVRRHRRAGQRHASSRSRTYTDAGRPASSRARPSSTTASRSRSRPAASAACWSSRGASASAPSSRSSRS